MIQNEKITRYLKCQLTPAEVALHAKTAAQNVKEITRLEKEAKESAAGYKARIAEKQNIISEASLKVENEYEYRDVECERIFDREAQRVSVVRLDTGAEEESRPFTASEKQLTLEEAEDAAQEPETNFQDPAEALAVVTVEVESENEPDGQLVNGEQY